jgi:CDP-glucose 4,6-dehydratase
MDLIEMRKILPFFKGKKVFITGHTGFKGSWLAFLLKELGADVRGFALEPHTFPSHFELLNLSKSIDHIVGDIRDSSLLSNTLQEFQPEVVFHLAAQALVKESYKDPTNTFEVNTMGSVNLLESVRMCDSVKSLVYITSDKCYENMEWIWGYREEDRLGGHDPYSASKGAAEIIFSAYSRSYFSSRPNLGVASTRAGNVIGGGDWAADRIIPDCIRAIENNVPIKIRNPNSYRPWQHVLEPITGYLTLGANLYENPKVYSGSWNFGPSTSEILTVKEIANNLIQCLGEGNIEIEKVNKEQYESNLLQLNCDKAKQLLGWSPRWSAKKTIIATSDWYKVFLNDGNIESITRDQIHNYYPELS